MSAFNSVLGIPPSMDLSYLHVPKEFNSNTFWYEIFGDHRYDTSNSKGMVIRNPCIRVTQRLLAYDLFAWQDSLNVPHLSELHFCITCLKVTELTPGHSWPISCIVQPLVLPRGLSLGASLPPLLG